MTRRPNYLRCEGQDWQKARMRALVRDDFTCQQPGCDETRLAYLEVHHIRQRSHGGSHCLENLQTLCKRHHADAHPYLRYHLGYDAVELDSYPWKEL